MFVGLVTAWRLATVPTSRSPPWVNATTDGVVRPPSAFSMTVGSPPSRTAMHEFVVPRSMPIVLAIRASPYKDLSRGDADYSRSGTSAKGRMLPQSGRRAWHVRRPCRSRFTWNSSSWPRGVMASISSCISSNGRLLAEQAQARAHAGDVGVDGDRRAARRRTAARRRRSCGRRRAARAGTRGPRGAARRAAPAGSPQDGLDAPRLDLGDAAGADRLLDLLVRGVADRLPGAEARRRRRKATSRLRSFVDWQRTVRISSSSAVPCGGAAGIP